MYNLKITITDDANKYESTKKKTSTVLGELKLNDSHHFHDHALNNLTETILTLFPNDPVNLEITYNVGNT